MNRRQLGVIFLTAFVIVPGLVLGYRLTRNPVELIELSLNKKAVTSDEELVLTVYNRGFKSVTTGYQVWIYRLYPNGSYREVDALPPNVAWPAVGINIFPLIGTHQEKVYIKHLDPGDYKLRKEFGIKGLGKHSNYIEFTIK